MRHKSWIIKDLLKVTADYLKEKEINSPRLTAEVLLSHQLNTDRVNLYLNFDQPLTEKEISGYRSLIKRRLRHEPIQYITGSQEFWSLDFMVDPQVIIPRPESELLVEQAINRVGANFAPQNQSPKILDLGTGSGALAISVAKEVPQARFWATDLSAAALSLARSNAEKHGVSERIQFMRGDLWDPIINLDITFDIIISNPPYITSEEYNDLAPEVRDYEPRLALDGHEGGMYFIEKIIQGGLDYLSPGGWLIMEMSPDQTEKALVLVEQIKGYGEKTRIKDYSHIYRVVMAQKVDS
ncbi:MAG: peptide chain release factor N(5)-glutamine methyltransferase [Deltaproteobacteria bacterium]|nr:peptide chain release factor N(5)-glutamine methyltransferase [Deltaproteobacteria bacterium]MBW1911080.1 peptide chain release factor N(5)-glutamine methyltransferase [Deltaproteobacteria bacterium]MBW2035401.1 peptide chain release factor N(5)-glutamine methyltransferase [Deltaproteobacteria bacterium]MBW2115690.1 peptide chain release factor N(5)-glutamine methyltransferase [Deltaproteobacteria bacterium]